ncbi:hypothetical protein GH810_07750 [Acetobacterium paludosum]|uniref:HTH luxR-type domain-containing protein n=1 Tax=Acetobacterium paludosum TaxID=52693 RepID=A0A923KW82_9FIRM|nr:LuxR C-terminal-related transcriptional regulator [Acetobacterium paludosum]MBC3888200.1 hypothetical protein [Acetobacterium paludosum]
MTINYTTDKFMCPSLPEICIPRPELFNLYNKAMKTCLVAVCAPAGYGKTVSTLLWARESKRKCIWIVLDEYDNIPSLFYNLFCTGIFSTQPNNKYMKEVLNSYTFKSAPIEHTIRFLSKIEQDEQSYTLIFDDFDTITNQTILESFSFILKRLPHSFNVVILSRGHLFENLNELIENRNSFIITSESLAFSLAETHGYYRALGRNINNSEAQLILEMTGGWAVGIHTLLQNDPIEDLKDSEQILYDYLTKNIWNKCNAELREFMLLTAVADELDAELCSILTDRKKAIVIFEKLIIQNAFIIKSSPDNYQYHLLFLNFLRYKLKERPDVNVQEINLKIADFYYKRRDFFTALDFYVRSENIDGINRSFFQLNTSFMDFSVEEWLNLFTTLVKNRLSEEIVQNDFSLLLEYAWANFLNGNAQSTLYYIDRINAYITVKENLETIFQSDLIGSIGIIRFADFRQGICTYSKDFSEWVRFFPENHSFKMYTPSITQNFPIMHRSICDCLEILSDMDNQLQIIKDAFSIFFPQEIDLFCYCVKAGLYYELNEIEKAYQTIGLAQNIVKKDTRFEMQFCLSMLLSHILNAMENKRESENIRLNFRLRIQNENAPFLYPNFLAIDVKHRLWDADRKAANMWLEEPYISTEEPLRFYRLYQYFTTARAYIVLSKSSEALALLENLKKISTDYRRPLDIAETGVLKAILEWAIGSRTEAIQLLETVLIDLQPYQAIRIVSDEGASVLPILKKLSTQIDSSDSIGPLNPHYLKQVYLCAYQVSKKHRGITALFNEKSIKLSKQQKTILSLLAKGYNNIEIVELTGRTINTVKSHTKMLYLKLDVHNAADAVLKAKQLGLLESSVQNF